MGIMTALGYIEAVEMGVITTEQAIRAHISSNFYPPHPEPMADVAVMAVELANQGKVDEIIEHEMWKQGYSVRYIIERLHLEPSVDN